MQNDPRYPEPTAADLGTQCLRAVTFDLRFSELVRSQAQRLLEMSRVEPPKQRAASSARVAFAY